VHRAAYDGTDSIHRFSGSPSEEILLLYGSSAPVRFKYEVLEVTGAVNVIPHGGGIRFVGADGRGLEIEAPWAVDAAGVRSDSAVRWVVGRLREDGTMLQLELDANGLEYPIAIDPSWRTIRGMGLARYGHTATLMTVGRVLVVGGQSAAHGHSRRIHLLRRATVKRRRSCQPFECSSPGVEMRRALCLGIGTDHD
jgi:hypothetical protein